MTPPSAKHRTSNVTDIDVTLSQAAKCLAQKASQKKAPLPPKRTSSFKDQMQPLPSQFRDLSKAHMTSAVDEWCLVTSMTDSIDMSNVTSESLSDHHRSQSSSDDLLSTPASQSRNGSLERILEHCRSPTNSPHSTHDISYSANSPAQSNEQKTPETDISDMSLPPPPAALLEDFSPDVPRLKRGVQHCAIADQQLLSQLRQGLKKTTAMKKSKRKQDENVDSGHSSPAGGGGLSSLSKAKEFVTGYRTLPKESGSRQVHQDELGHGVGIRRTSDINRSFVNGKTSLENRLSESCSNLTDMVLQMPTPEVRRKVEEWQAGVERSLSELESPVVAKDVNAEEGAAFQPSDRIRSSQHSYESSVPSVQPLCIANYIMKTHPQQVSSSTVGSVGAESNDISVKMRNKIIPGHDNSSTDVTESSSRGQVFQQPDKPKWKVSRKKPAHDNLESEASTSVLPAPLENRLLQPGGGPSNLLSGPGSSSPGNFKSETGRRRLTIAQGHGEEPVSSSADAARAFAKPLDPQASSLDIKPQAKPRKAVEVQTRNTEPPGTVAGASSLLKGDVALRKLSQVKQQSLESEAISEESHSSAKLFSSKAVKDVVSDGLRPVPTGAKPALPGLPGLKPNQASPLVAAQQLSARASLHHVSPEKEKVEPSLAVPVTKETVARMTQSLSHNLELLNSSETRHSSWALMQFSEEVQTLHRICSNYVESLPPHGKFQFREILSSLETVAEGLKMSSGSSMKDYDRLLVNLQSCLRGIEGTLKR